MPSASIDPKSNLQLAKPDIIPAFDQEGFIYTAVDADAWDQLYPFQLIILQVSKEEPFTYEVTPFRFTLPIAPQEISISMPVADQIIPTLRGYAEIHGGAPFRNISMSGTMGIWPDREAVVKSSSSNPITTAVAPLTNAISELVTGAPPRIDNAKSTSTFPTAITGFYKFHQLKAFLEGYTALRRRADPIRPGSDDDQIPGNKMTLYPERLRLALAIWKDSSVYVCRLAQFDGPIRSAARPLEYRYSMQLQAYKRVDINEQGQAQSELKINLNKANRLFDVMNRINAARKILAAGQQLLSFGVLGPLSLINEFSRQISGVVKDVLGISRAIIDMPATFARSVVGSILEASKQIGAGIADIKDAGNSYNGLSDELKSELAAAGAQLGLGAASDHSGTTRLQLVGVDDVTLTPNSPTTGSGFVPDPFTDNNKVGKPGINATGIDPDDLLDAVAGLRDLVLSQIALNAQQQAALTAEIQASLSKSITDFEDIRDAIQQNLDAFVTAIGSWNHSYNQIYGLPDPVVAQREPTPEELDIVFSVNEILISTDQFITYLKDNQNQVTPGVNSLEFVASLAQQAGIFFQIPRSKFSVPFPYGHTLERLALQFLGDANRWHEIAVLNGLREPYVDEEGFAVPLLTNASGNQIVVASDENLFIGQRVFLTSDTERPAVRNIADINRLTPGQIVLTLDGDGLEDYKIADHAKLRAFLPGTINSQSLVYIPADTDPTAPLTDINVPGINPLDPLIRLGGVDLLLADNLDLVVTPSGDNPLAIGLINMTQTVKLALKTRPGSLLQHPAWGFDARPGDSVADVDLPALLRNLRTLFSGDLDFAGIRSALVQKVGNVLRLDIQLGINGLNRTLPVTLAIGSRAGQS